ncbi:MAG: glycosyltransferase family 4 protein [Chitinophagaceae bacterium]|nr:glycosyltransferase family 4 protein [Chitinophagaceae bacterium]
MKKTLIRITTVPMAFKVLLKDQIKFMVKNGFDVIMVGADGKERSDVINNEGARYVIVPMTRKITPFADLICLIKLIRVMKKYHPAIVHSHTPKAGLLGMIAARISGVKIRIHTVAGLTLMAEKGLKKNILLQTERITYSCATNVWPNSFSLYKYIQKHKLASPKKLKVIANGSTNGINFETYSRNNLDKNKIEVLKKSLPFESKLLLLFVGRIVRDKGIEELISVFRIMQKKFPIQLILIGPFEDNLDPIAGITKKEIIENPNITQINWSDDVPYYMAISDILIHPSHREGFPNVILQAGALELPIVCSNIDGNIDIVTSSEMGYVFKVKDEKSLTKYLTNCISNKEERISKAKTLHDKIVELYNQKFVQQEILKNYNSLLALHDRK